ncbi:MAG: hypothetical protein UT32_C0001G0070 [Parcubacteria group bacterium GW2011_GWC2_39_14]|nr:MAG: hypothetical protein UT32_C0001G0070 [Parcubacteria group bacterium GW2011_GWC2_39_14]KKR55494.1 MAG: hypothetical protein UT91_C0001G0069 [Parcubacteria group bacterium GW2011_GWA2_40_23]
MSLTDFIKQNQPQSNGLLTCARYAFMPNRLQYCGGPNNEELFAYNTENVSDPGLSALLKEFQTLFPYLKLIAESNKIKDVFDARIVEAYWLGNELLENVSMKRLYSHFVDGLHLKKKLQPKDLELLMGKIPRGAIPHHCFHVLNIYFRTGHLAVPHTLESMDSCRIGWGKVKKISENDLIVETQRLVYENNRLKLSETIDKNISFKLLHKSFLQNPTIGDNISYHWGWACDKITEKQKTNLKKYTQACLDIANGLTKLN